MKRSTVRHENKLWLDQEFSFLTEHPCFWCDDILTRSNSTTDHLVPLHIGGSDLSGNKVISCCKCNRERSKISTLASYLLTQKVWTRRNKKTWMNQKAKIRTLLHKFRALISDRVTDEGIRNACLDEVNMVIRTQTSKFKEEE